MDTNENKTLALAPGTLLHNGDYRIEKLLGGGGFGITYLSTWIQRQKTGLKTIVTEKTVVVKEFFYKEFCMRTKGATTISIPNEERRHDFERLRRKLTSEAHILNSLEHPNIVDVFDVFEENNTAYIVMAFVDGSDLEEIIAARGSHTIAQYIKYVAQIASALDEVHRKHILHLDISPSNILIDRNDNAQLIDFGISQSYDEQGKVKVTSKLIAGRKPHFSPPEQSSAASLEKFSPPIDIYALGATLYNCLTGEKPPESVLLSTGNELLAFPSAFNPDIPAHVDEVVLKAMNIRSNERFQTAADFRKALLEGGTRYDSLVANANRYYNEGRYSEALKEYQSAQAITNSNNTLDEAMERCRQKLKGTENRRQEQEANEAEARKKAKFNELCATAEKQQQTKQYAQAITTLQQALLLYPGNTTCSEKIEQYGRKQRKLEQEQEKKKQFDYWLAEGKKMLNNGHGQVAKENFEKAATLYTTDEVKHLIAHCNELIEAQKNEAIEKQRLEEARKKAEQQKREEEQRKKEEARKKAEQQKREEEQRKKEEARKKAEQQKREEEQRKQEEARKKAEQQKREEDARKAEYQKQADAKKDNTRVIGPTTGETQILPELKEKPNGESKSMIWGIVGTIVAIVVASVLWFILQNKQADTYLSPAPDSQTMAADTAMVTPGTSYTIPNSNKTSTENMAPSTPQQPIATAGADRNSEIKNAIAAADRAFANKKWNEAFAQYKKAKDLGGDVTGGYDKFLDQAKKLRVNLGIKCDSNIKTHLNYAKELKNTAEVNELLTNCN